MRNYLFILLLLTPIAEANEYAYELLDVAGIKLYLADFPNEMKQYVLKKSPQFRDRSDVVQKWANKYFGWREQRKSLSKIFTSRFTDSELDVLVMLYKKTSEEELRKSDVGKKYLRLQPEISLEIRSHGGKYLKKVYPHLIEMIKG